MGRPLSRSLGLFHLDLYAHPRMDAALKTMFTFRQMRDLEMTALKDSSPGHLDLRKPTGTFGNRLLSGRVEPRYKTATEVRHLGESVGFTTLVDYADFCSFIDPEYVRFEVPTPVRSSGGRLCK